MYTYTYTREPELQTSSYNRFYFHEAALLLLLARLTLGRNERKSERNKFEYVYRHAHRRDHLSGMIDSPTAVELRFRDELYARCICVQLQFL